MSRLVPLGPVKQRYCPECKLIVSQLCTHVVDPVITTDTKKSPERAPVFTVTPLLPTTPQQLEERVEARKKVDLATPDITENGQLVFRYVPKMKYCTSPYTRVYPRFEASGNIFGPLERNFKDDRVYKEGSFTPRKRQPRKAKPASKVEAVPIKPVSPLFQKHTSILALRKEWIESRRGLYTSPNKCKEPETTPSSDERPYVLQLPEVACESAGQA